MDATQSSQSPSEIETLTSVHQPEKVDWQAQVPISTAQECTQDSISYVRRPSLGRIQELADQMNMSYDEFIGEMRKRGCSEPTALKIWLGLYDSFTNFNDNDLYLSNLRKAADVFKVPTGMLLTK